MWAVDLRQSHEIPKAWIENASDLNSVLKKRKKKPPPPPIAKTGPCLENINPTENCGNRANISKKG